MLTQEAFNVGQRGVDVGVAAKAETAFQASGTVKNEKPIDVFGLLTINKASVGGDLNAVVIGGSVNIGVVAKNGRFRLKVGAGLTAFIGARVQLGLDITVNKNALQNISDYYSKLIGD
jgi:hypothetical protein